MPSQNVPTVVDFCGYQVHRTGKVIGKRGHPLKPTMCSSGAYQVTINGKQCMLAHVIYEAFAGVKPFRIIHKDRDKTNCAFENLEEL